MNYRQLGRTKLRISEIGFGAWGIGKSMWVGAEDDESIRSFHTAVDNGLNFIDTALVYGNGHSERLVGRFTRERKEEIYLATKVPPKNFRWPARPGIPIDQVYPAEHVIKSTKSSLKNLQVDSIDLLQLHVWNDEWVPCDELAETIESLKKEGLIRFFGVSINDHQPENAIKLIHSGQVDTVQVIFNIFDQSPSEKLFPVCIEKDIGVIVRVPLDEGGLTGKIRKDTTFPDGDFRNRYFKGDRKEEIEDHLERLEPIRSSLECSFSELALKFCLAFDAVSTVIPGMRTEAHARENCLVSDGKSLGEKEIAELKKHAWIRSFY